MNVTDTSNLRRGRSKVSVDGPSSAGGILTSSFDPRETTSTCECNFYLKRNARLYFETKAA